MATYLGFLRAINLGATRKFPKEAIVEAVEAAGFTGVATHINTGNVRFETSMRSRARIEAALEDAFREKAGFEVPTICFTTAEFTRINEYAASLGHDGKHYVSLLKVEPTAEVGAVLEASSVPGETVRVEGRGVHLMLGENYHTAKLTNVVVEKHLGVATNRNLTVVRAITQKWC